MEFFFDKIIWFGDARRTTDKPVVSLNSKLGRIVIYQKTLALLREKMGKEKELEYVRLGATPEHPNAFWIQPCEKGDDHSKKVHKMGTTRMISAKSLFNALKKKRLGPPKGKTVQYPVVWADGADALMVDLTPSSEESSQD